MPYQYKSSGTNSQVCVHPLSHHRWGSHPLTLCCML